MVAPTPIMGERERLMPWRYSLVGVGALHTLLCAGVVFGWSSLEAVLRSEGRFGAAPDELFALVFTLGAVGNYVSNLPFGALLDRKGPRFLGCVASVLFAAAVALSAEGCRRGSPALLGCGFFGLGFLGPAIQLPTLSLSCLFEDGAVAMSLQAAAFDGGASVFAVGRLLKDAVGLGSGAFLTCYLAVPAFCFVTALTCWPRRSLEAVDQDVTRSPGGAGSPFLPARLGSRSGSFTSSPSFAALVEEKKATAAAQQQQQPPPAAPPMAGATLGACVASKQFRFLALFAAVHILKLNFVVTSVNAQLALLLPGRATRAAALSRAFGAMLPFGFVSAPGTAFLLGSDPVKAFTAANVLGVVYGGAFMSRTPEALLVVVFPLVALSRQLVYSSVFHTVGAQFGFANYGTLLGIINVVVATLGCLQYPLVSYSTTERNYDVANLFLFLITFPLFGARAFLETPEPRRREARRAPRATEKTTLVRPKSLSEVGTSVQDLA